MSATDDTARRERAEKWARHGSLADDDLWAAADSISRSIGAQRRGATTHGIVGYLAGAREEAAIKDAEIAALVDQTYRLGERCAEEQSARVREQDEARAEIAALREAISDFLCECSLEFSDDRVSYERWQISSGAIDDLRRALGEKP